MKNLYKSRQCVAIPVRANSNCCIVYVQVQYVPIIYGIYKRCASQISLLKVILSKLIPHLITHYERPHNNYVRNNTNKSLF